MKTKQYTVWVGGSEIGTYATEDDAVEVYDEWRDDGYLDVEIDEWETQIDREKENKMNTRTYKVTNTGNFEVALANDGEYGYFEHNELGDESGGGLWFKDGAIYDYDGVAELPSEVVVELENRGVDIRYLKED